MTTCPKCQHANADGLKFCENCGAALARQCPNCGQPVSPGARFCGNCGAALETVADPQVERLKKLVPREFAERLLRSRGGQIERERRVVTILFCDVKGSTALGEERDPEEILEIMNGAFDALIEPVYRYEGTLARLMGDAILAFFGAPVAHEDDAVRAVLAALAIQDQMRGYAAKLEKTRGIRDFAVRVGINTGLVVVGEVGSDLRVEYTAMGDAINVASRLENAAAPGSIVISANTARLVRHAFDLESLGGLALKGKAEPVIAYRVVGRKVTMESPRGIEGLHSPLVGREEQVEKLRGRLDELLQGRGQIISIMGEAGLGKSRLLAELRREYAGTEGQNPQLLNLRWLEGRSLSYETSTPFAPFIDLLSELFSFEPEEKDLDRYARLQSRLTEWMPDRASELAPFIATLLGIELLGEELDRIRYLMPPDLRERIFRAVLALVEQLAHLQPTVLVLEDLHWADPTSLDLAIRLLDLTDRTPLLMVALFRPQRQEPSWRFHETAARDFAHRYASISLEPLDDSHARQLVANLLEIEDLPESVRALILKKAEGNPFFVEEVIRSLLDAGLVVRENSHWRATREIENVTVPDTLAGVITARLDRLDEESRHVAQTASVIGREFWQDVLQEVSASGTALEEPLRHLQRRELIREKSRTPAVLHLFKHALTQETAYASVLISRRRELHRRVAECIERIDPERVNEIARHFLQAGDEPRALPYLLASGERAARAYAMPEAIGYYSRAVAIARAGSNLGLTRRAYEGLGSAYDFVFDAPHAVESYQQMLSLAQEKGDIPMQVSATNKLAYTLAYRLGQFPDAEKHLVDAEQLAREHQDKPGLTETYFIRCGMCTAVGDYDNVVNYMEQAAQFGREMNVKDQIVAALDHVARSHMFMTRFEEGWKAAQEGLGLAREVRNRDLEAALLTSTVPIYHIHNADLDAAFQAAKEGSDIATRIGSPFWIVIGNWTLGEISRRRGEYQQAVAFLQQAVQKAFALEQTMPFLLAQPLASLGTAYIEISPAYAARAGELHMHALELLQTPGGMSAGGTAWCDIGFCALAQGNVTTAGELFQKGLTYPTMFGYYNKPRFLLGAALVALMEKRIDEAAHQAGEAATFVQDRAMQDLYPLVALVQGQVEAARGEHARALAEFARAVELGGRGKLRPVVLQAHAAAANSLSGLGRTTEAEAERRSAQTTIDEIAGLFTDPEMRQAFVTGAARLLNDSQVVTQE